LRRRSIAEAGRSSAIRIFTGLRKV